MSDTLDDIGELLAALEAMAERTKLLFPVNEREALVALDALVAERDEAQRLLREVVKADRQDAQMGYPIPGDSCMGAFIGLVLMQYLDSLAKEEG